LAVDSLDVLMHEVLALQLVLLELVAQLLPNVAQGYLISFCSWSHKTATAKLILKYLIFNFNISFVFSRSVLLLDNL